LGCGDGRVAHALRTASNQQLVPTSRIVYFSDRGFHLGDHGGLWAKLGSVDRSTRVPLIMAGAGVPRGTVVATP
jgi:hypothetical protein